MATLKDIAEKAGVSIGTVDRIMHNRGRFSPETAEKVRRIMEELDYRPNLMARHLSRSAECRIGLFLPSRTGQRLLVTAHGRGPAGPSMIWKPSVSAWRYCTTIAMTPRASAKPAISA